MALDNTTQLSIAELVLYLLLVPIIVYILIRHGKSGYLGWGFLLIFCCLRLASDGLQIANQSSSSNSSSGAILNSVGLSALLCSLSGIIHESYKCIPNHNRKTSLIIQLILHLMISTGIALAASGGSNLAQTESPSNKHSTDNALRRIGSILLFTSSVLLVAYAYTTHHHLKSLPVALLNRDALHLLYSTMLASPFVLVRAVYNVVYAFDSSPGLNPVSGSFATKFVLVFLVQLLAVLLVASGGIVTKDIRRGEERLRYGAGCAPTTRSGPRQGSQSERHIMGEYSGVQEQPVKSVRSESSQGV